MTDRSRQWRNRITGYAEVPPDQLLANPANYRRHPREQQAALTGVIDEIGYLDPVLVQAGTDLVIDGHLRVELALRANQPTIPVQYVDLTDDEARLALATFDPVTAMAYHDTEQLDALLREVSASDAAVMALLGELSRIEVIGADVDDTLHRTTNNLQMIGKGGAVGLQMGDLMVTIDRQLYEDVWAHVNGPHYADRRAGITAILAAGLQSLEDVPC